MSDKEDMKENIAAHAEYEQGNFYFHPDTKAELIVVGNELGYEQGNVTILRNVQISVDGIDINKDNGFITQDLTFSKPVYVPPEPNPYLPTLEEIERLDDRLFWGVVGFSGAIFFSLVSWIIIWAVYHA